MYNTDPETYCAVTQVMFSLKKSDFDPQLLQNPKFANDIENLFQAIIEEGFACHCQDKHFAELAHKKSYEKIYLEELYRACFRYVNTCEHLDQVASKLGTVKPLI